MKQTILFVLVILMGLACQKDDGNDPENPYQFVRPSHFPEPTYTFENNPVTENGFKLGKKIFNDPILSIDNSIACSSCHVKSVAFADPQHRLSLGVFERVGIRNAPGIANMAFMKEFLWDGGGIHLDFVPPNAIENPVEMNETLAHVVQKLNAHSEYPDLFQEVFGPIDSINAPLMLYALSQYMNLLVSANSAYDQFYLGKGSLTANQQKGMKLFEEKCASCHSGVLFTNQDYRNNGLDTVFMDEGRARITEWDGDLGKFKVPSLRNVAITAPYMHDGRFNTLEEVLDHYAQGVIMSPTLASELQQNNKLGIDLTTDEQQLIIEFLQTLTDWEFISNPIF
ncbi:MAG: c-type cytochrome [Saprospirales bacterium]|nr:c-type cytochrome [Saprospirales bacterium]